MDERLTIILIAGSRATHARRLLQMLLDGGHSVTYIDYTNPEPERAEHFTFLKYPEHSCPRWVRPDFLRRVLKNWTIVLSLRRIWKKIKPDVVHVVDIEKRAYRCALAGIHPLILTSYGSDINDLFESGDRGSRQWKEVARALQTADHITADTWELLKRCELIAGRPLDTSLFYFGIDLDLFKPREAGEKEALRDTLGISPGFKVILSPRRLNPKMRQDVILKAFAEVIRDGRQRAVLVLRRFGYYYLPNEDELKKMAAELGVIDYIVWANEMDYEQIPVLYSLADLIINVPTQDGLPVTLFEASACMVPVITSNLPAYQEFLSGGAYLQVPVGDVATLVETMRLVLEGKIDLEEGLQKNYQLVLEKADQKKCFLDIEQVYHRAARSGQMVG
jgi:glycosyltransferase involved in cell wall biosynthesis